MDTMMHAEILGSGRIRRIMQYRPRYRPPAATVTSLLSAHATRKVVERRGKIIAARRLRKLAASN